MSKVLQPQGRLIVAADFKPTGLEGRGWVRGRVLTLADQLRDTGVCIKLNSALRACGYTLIEEIHMRGLTVFADLKLNDIGETLATDGLLLKKANPELLTAMCSSGIKGLRSLKSELPNTEVLGVTVLTSLDDEEAERVYGCSVYEAVLKMAIIAKDAGIDGLISSASEVSMLRSKFGTELTLNTPAIRPVWAAVKGDDQNLHRTMTPAAAIKAGSDRIVVGRPITQAVNPYDAVMLTIDEIMSVKV